MIDARTDTWWQHIPNLVYAVTYTKRAMHMRDAYASRGKNCPIFMKFDTLHQILNPITVTWPKIEIFYIRGGDGRHLEKSFFGHNSSTDCPMSAKFCIRKQNGMPTKATWQKLQFFKIQDGGRPPFRKPLNYLISVKILLDFDKIWCTTACINLMRLLQALSQNLRCDKVTINE